LPSTREELTQNPGRDVRIKTCKRQALVSR